VIHGGGGVRRAERTSRGNVPNGVKEKGQRGSRTNAFGRAPGGGEGGGVSGKGTQRQEDVTTKGKRGQTESANLKTKKNCEKRKKKNKKITSHANQSNGLG